MRLTAVNITSCTITTAQLPRGLPRVVFGLFKDALFEKWREVTQVPFSEGPTGRGRYGTIWDSGAESNE